MSIKSILQSLVDPNTADAAKALSDAELKTALERASDGLRAVHEQAEMLRAEGKVKRVGCLTVIKAEGVIKHGNSNLTPQEVALAMAELGWECKWVGGVAGMAAE